MWKAFVAVTLFVTLSDVAISQEVIAAPVECGVLCQALKSFPEINAWLIAIFTAIGLILRAVADLLAFIGSKVEKKAVGEWGIRFNSYALWAAQIIGWFGGGTPKAVLEKKLADKK